MHLVLLHSEVESSGKGNSYLVGLNGTKIGTQEQLGQLCALDLSGVAALSCLTASGGTANGITTGAAEVLGVQSTLPLNPASAFATTGTAGDGDAPAVDPRVGGGSRPGRRGAPGRGRGSDAAALPRTGAAAGLAGGVGLAGLLMGSVLRVLGRRRVAPPDAIRQCHRHQWGIDWVGHPSRCPTCC